MFHTYPFLEVSHRAFSSCREFVKYQLPEWQTSSPEALGGQTEQEMEEEIDNHDAKVVDGDGVEVSLEDAVDGGWASEASQDESSSEQECLEDMESSWIKPQDGPVLSPWPSPPTSDDEDHAPHDTPPSVPRSPSTQSNEWPSPMKRIQSTLSSIVEATAASLVGGGSSQLQSEGSRSLPQITSPSPRFKTSGGSVPTIQTPTSQSPTSSPTKRNHRRTPSSQYPLRGALPSHGSTSSANGFLIIEPHEQAPPRPVVRRMSSHPDILSLCDSWASTGPANQTVNFYKTSPSSFLNPTSLALTQARTNGSTNTSRSGGQDTSTAHQHQAARKSIQGLFLTPASAQH